MRTRVNDDGKREMEKKRRREEKDRKQEKRGEDLRVTKKLGRMI